MYEKFYGLTRRPFDLSPDPQFLYFSKKHREALAALTYSTLTHDGLTVLLGDVGTGKTTLIYSLVNILRKQRFSIALITNPKLTCEEFYDAALLNLGVECGSSLKSRRVAALQEALLQRLEMGRRSLLIIDEGQCLSTETLEEVRLMGNMETPSQKLLNIVVAGQPELARTLGDYGLRSLSQRINRICRLEALDAGEVKPYIDHRLRQAGLPNQTIFDEAGCRRVLEYARGIPRLVNSICDSALHIGFASHAPKVNEDILSEAAADLCLETVDSYLGTLDRTLAGH